MANRSHARVPPGSVRIIGGEWRGRRLAIPPRSQLRPTPDRVRETLFNWLRADLPAARVLDLFAGTGCLGIEALSRGAAEACFVERDRQLAAALTTQIATLGAAARVIHGEAQQFLERPVAAGFDVVFVDPPYDQAVEPVLALLRPWLNAGAMVYVERRADAALPQIAAAQWLKQSRAAAVAFGLLAFEAAPNI